MRPIQIWLPTLGPSPNLSEVARDRDRAFRAWEGESSVWLMPDLNRQTRWDKDGIRDLAIPAERFDHLEVFHVSEKGQVSGPSVNDYFPGGRLDGLLQAWLNVWKLGGVALHPVPNHFEMEVPEITSNGVRYRKRKITLEGAPSFPLHPPEPNSETSELRWPPRGCPPTVSPDAEIMTRRSHTGTHADDKRLTLESGGMLMQFLLNWPKPLDNFLPILSGLDDLSCQAIMSDIARDSRREQERSIIKVRELCLPTRIGGRNWRAQFHGYLTGKARRNRLDSFG